LMIPEWEVVQRVIQENQQEQPQAWADFAECSEAEAYTDGSCPIKNPGGPAGFAAVLGGYDESIDENKSERPEPYARIDLAGYIPARRTEPPTSNNRAEIAGILAACEALRQLGLRGYRFQRVTIWSDSQYAVNCATGVWKRKKNTDLWPIFDRIDREVRTWAAEFSLKWVRGHAGNRHNEAADVLATRAAFNFDLGRYNAFRAAQQATGKEMPGKAGGVQAIAKTPAVHTPTTAVQVPMPMPMPGVPDANRPDSITIPATPTANPADWLDGADYRLVLYTHVKKGDTPLGGPHIGDYRLWAKDGRSRARIVRHEGSHTGDEAEYLTLIEALNDIVDRITKSGRDTRNYSLRIYSRQELMVKQLRGEYKVKAPALQQVYRQAAALLARFKSATLAYRDAASIREMLEE
jgi:ribonuclease HI